VSAAWIAFGAPWAPVATNVAVPRVIGPRATVSDHPVYRFRAAGATGFRCAFDSTLLHRCGARYSEGLTTGAHILRVRAIGRGGKLSRTVSLRITVRPAPTAPTLEASPAVAISPEPGVPAVAAGAVWVPSSADGTVLRIDPATRSATATIAAVAPAPARPACDTFSACGYINTALGAGTDLWVTCDACGEVARIDTTTNRVVARVAVPPRPGGLALGGGFLWAFHTLDSTVSRIDPATGSVATFSVPGVEGAGIAFSRGSVWLLSSARPSQVLRLDPRTLSVQARVPLNPSGQQHPLKEAWGLVGDEARLWAADPNYNMVTEIDPATNAVRRRVRGISQSPMDQPFGIALAGNDVWVATRSGVNRIDERTGEIRGAIWLPSAGSGLIGVAFGLGAAWVSHYDRGTLTRIVPRGGRS
jgi:DNA-binding beta-propeller fold protein YncE